jgi:hypothetical protein
MCPGVFQDHCSALCRGQHFIFETDGSFQLTHDSTNVYAEFAEQACVDEPILPVGSHPLVSSSDETHDHRSEGEEERHDRRGHHLVSNVVFCHCVRHGW